MNKVNEAADFIKNKMKVEPEIGLVLGSGLGNLVDQIKNQTAIKYEAIPHFPTSTVKGHAGQFVFGTLQGKSVVAMQGRFHYYEGYSLAEVTLPIRTMKRLGIKSLILTNAAGGINLAFEPGNLMIITDHLNLFGTNPLIGANEDDFGVRFPDMTAVYHPSYIKHVKKCAQKLNINIKEGIYVGNTGPSYETPAEIKMLRTLGGDAVGMSTVPEAIIAKHADLKVLGISCISNMAAGILDEQLSHDDVILTAKKTEKDFINLMLEVIKTFPKS